MATIAFTRSSQVGGSDVPSLTHEKTVSVSGGGWTKFGPETITAGTDTLVNIAIDVSEVEFVRIHSTTAATIETNAIDATGGNTIVLVAGKPYDFVTGDYTPLLLTLDVTKLYVTNVADTVLTVEVLQDATP
jgi:hypothetical protein